MTDDIRERHDAAEARERKRARAEIADWPIPVLLGMQDFYRMQCRYDGPTHRAVAMCEEIYKRIAELEQEGKP